MSTKVEQHRIAIAGSGPVGLYLAIMLKVRCPKLDVMVLDSRMDEYERPGIIAKQAIVEINKGLKQMGIPPIDVPDSGGIPANNVFIRQLQQALVTHAKKVGATLVKDSFDTLEGNVITTKEKKLIPCNMLIDCTGETRAVAKSIKNTAGQSLFKIDTISDNPIKNHFIAYVDMDKENCALYGSKISKPILYVQAMQELRALGWQEFAEPELTTTRWDNKEGSARFCFYFELADNVAQQSSQKQAAYLQALLYLKTGKHINFTIVQNKLNFIPFSVEPKVVTEPLNMQPIPVVSCGDALMSPEYRLGTGVRNGVTCANTLVMSIKTTPLGELAFDQSEYIRQRMPTMNEHIKLVTSEYQSKKNKLASSDLENAYKLYTEAVLLLDPPQEKGKEKDKDTKTDNDLLLKIEQGLMDLAIKFSSAADGKYSSAAVKKEQKQNFESDLREAIKFYENAIAIYQKFCPHLQATHEKIITNELTKLHSNLAKTYFKLGRMDAAIQHADFSAKLAQRHDISDRGLLDLAEQFKLEGNAQYNAKNLGEARRHYDGALIIYQQFCPHLQKLYGKTINSEITKIHSNIAKAYFYENNINAAIRSLEKAMDHAKQYDVTEMLAKEKLPKSLKDYYTKALSSCEKDDWFTKMPLLSKLVDATTLCGENSDVHKLEIQRLDKIRVLQIEMKQKASQLQAVANQMPGDSLTGNPSNPQFK